MKSRRWSSVFTAIQEFGTHLHKYASYLESQNEQVKKRQAATSTRSDVDEIEVLAPSPVLVSHSEHYEPLH